VPLLLLLLLLLLGCDDVADEMCWVASQEGCSTALCAKCVFGRCRCSVRLSELLLGVSMPLPLCC
jgi:hypothetical protein